MSLKGLAMTDRVLRGKIKDIKQIEEVNALYAEAEKMLEREKEAVYSLTNVANALKGYAEGQTVTLSDISPLEHDIKVNLKKTIFTSDKANFFNASPATGEFVVSDLYDDSTGYFVEFESGEIISLSKSMWGDTDPTAELSVGDTVYINYTSSDESWFAYIADDSTTLTKYGKNLFSKNIPSYSIGNSSVVDNGDGSITVTKKAGDSFASIYSDWFYLKKGTYTFSNGLGRDTVVSGLNPIYMLIYSQKSGSSVCSLDARDYSAFTIAESGNFRVRVYSAASTDVASPVTIYPQIEIGDKYTGFERYKEPISYIPNADGTVDGVTSFYPTTTLVTDIEGVTITAEYNRDANKVISELCEMGEEFADIRVNLKNGLTDLDNFRLPLCIIEKEYISSSPALNGVPQKGNTWDRTDYTECGGLDHLYIKVPAHFINNAFYDENKEFISIFSVAKSDDYYEVPIPENAKYFILSESRENLSQVVVKSKIGIAIDNIEAEIESVKENLGEKVSTVNGYTPDENGNVNISVSGSAKTDSECYLLKKEIPSYYTDIPSNPTSFEDDSYIESKINSIPSDKPSFIFVTDMHYPSNAKKSLLLMPYIKNRLGINTVIHGGDALDYDPSNKYKAAGRLREWIYDMRSAFGSSLLPVHGNHDRNPGNLSKDDIEELEESLIPYSLVEKITLSGCRNRIVQETDEAIADRIASLGVTIPDEDKSDVYAWYKMHYYSDDSENKTRYIVLNYGEGNNIIMHKYFGVGDANGLRLQMDWFYDTLKNTPIDFNIVVACHRWIEGELSTPELSNRVSTYVLQEAVKMLSLLKIGGAGYIMRAVSVTNNDGEAMLNAESRIFDFSQHKQNGKIVCVCGHMHWDSACICHTVDGTYKSDVYSDALEQSEDSILLILTQTDAIRAANYDMSKYPNAVAAGAVQHPMTEGTVTEQCFDVITLKDDSVVCTRIGAGEDRVFNY